ncbi:MAG: GntR family transcriptional regulator [Chloroflexi bacterium]|nr:GntR family transcriptional regulator [Chloroflexota bacterium]
MRKKTRSTQPPRPRRKPASLALHVYEKIRSDILTCALKPGQQVTQVQLVDKFQVGVTPVREALQRLAQEGLVQSIPRFGYIVSAITLADVCALYEFRKIIESAAVRLAAERASDGQLAQIAQAVNFTYTFGDRQSYTDFLAHNAEFHCAIARASGNPRLGALVYALNNELIRVFHLGLDVRDSAREMRDEHIALVNALKARDADRAERILQKQNAKSEERVKEALLRNGNLSASNIAREILANRPRILPNASARRRKETRAH